MLTPDITSDLSDMAYLYTLYRQNGKVTYAELRSAVSDLPFFHPHGASEYVCDIPQRHLWMKFTVETDGSITVHIPPEVFAQNTRMVSDLCHSLATQLRAGIFDHQLERDLDPNEAMTPAAPERFAGGGMASGPAWLLNSPLATLASVLLLCAALGLLTLIATLLFNIASIVPFF